MRRLLLLALLLHDLIDASEKYYETEIDTDLPRRKLDDWIDGMDTKLIRARRLIDVAELSPRDKSRYEDGRRKLMIRKGRNYVDHRGIKRMQALQKQNPYLKRAMGDEGMDEYEQLPNDEALRYEVGSEEALDAGITYRQTQNMDCNRPNERFESCFAGCASVSCDNPRDRMRPCYPFCEAGCICLHPYVRDDRTHKCVLPEECSRGLKGIPDIGFE